MKKIISTIFIASMPLGVWGHSGMDLTANTSLNAAMTVNYRSDSAVHEGQSWHIDGAMMGGEALPAQEGVSVEELFLTLSHSSEDGVYGLLQMANHQGSELEMEHAWVGYRLAAMTNYTLYGEAGRMAGLFSPANMVHSDRRLMSDAPLALDVFLGRQYNDEGFRLLFGDGIEKQGWLLGIESWRGTAFPATSGEDGGATDVFIRYQHGKEKLNWSVGGWYMRAEADSRTDNRHESEHGHGAEADESAAFWFDGDTTLYGVNVGVQWRLTSMFILGVESEWIWQKTDGNVRDETRIARLEGDANGGWFEPSLTYQRHKIGVRYERMVLTNDLSGAASEALAELGHLHNTGHNPTRVTLAYRYQLHPALALRAEWLNDKSSEHREERWLVGAVWQKNIWNKK